MGAVSASERLLVVYASMPDGDQVAPVGPKKGAGP